MLKEKTDNLLRDSISQAGGLKGGLHKEFWRRALTTPLSSGFSSWCLRQTHATSMLPCVVHVVSGALLSLYLCNWGGSKPFKASFKTGPHAMRTYTDVNEDQCWADSKQLSLSDITAFVLAAAVLADHGQTSLQNDCIFLTWLPKQTFLGWSS